MIEVIDGGRWTTIQDRGRPGLERFGIPSSGAADWFAAAVANRLVGNQEDAALLECTAAGPTLRFAADCVVAATGAECAGTPGWGSLRVPGSSVLVVGAIAPGLRTYLAVRGGIDVPVVLGSRSFCQRGAFGGGFGRPLVEGDRLAIGDAIHGEPLSGEWPNSHRLPSRGPWEVRVIAGPHQNAFDPTAMHRLTETACRVTSQLDRMGIRMATPALRLQAAEILTTPVTAGAIQVTPSGELIALLVDHQTTGGYPVIATVINADLPLLAQARPGETVRFRDVDAAEAARASRRLTDWLQP
ncbi:MAG TPA: biotin-dependent carboxyltransferase family protein [Candidatus Dormibacteraeota bacterium]|nr:biotin-dependent carboxyltransferase family protein [Candidatus Dormibacteraeota bacterium]